MDYKFLLNYAVKLLAARRLHSCELRTKLQNKVRRAALSGRAAGTDLEADIEKVINRLQELKYLNDNEYLELFVKDQIQKKPQGIRLLQQKLQRKKIPLEQIKQKLSVAVLDEFSLAKAALTKKEKLLKHDLPQEKKREKLFRFLAARGFSSETIFTLLNE